MGVTVSSSHVVSAAPSSSGLLSPLTAHTLPLLQREVPLMEDKILQCESFPWAAALHELLQHGSFPWAAVLHKLTQRGSLPWGAVLQEQAAPAWVPHGITSPDSKPAPAWAPLSMGPQVLPGACFSMGSPWSHSLLQASTCSSVGSPTGCRWIATLLWTSIGCRGTACLTMVFIMGCKGKLTAPGSQAPPPPPSSLTLVSAELFLSHCLTPLSLLLLHRRFFPFINMLSQRH